MKAEWKTQKLQETQKVREILYEKIVCRYLQSKGRGFLKVGIEDVWSRSRD